MLHLQQQSEATFKHVLSLPYFLSIEEIEEHMENIFFDEGMLLGNLHDRFGQSLSRVLQRELHEQYH